MMLIGVDYHWSFQTIAFLVEETSECGEQELKHSDGEALPSAEVGPCALHNRIGL
jgi:hypothetical protein